MFKVRGATVYPSEVEAALNSITAVAQAHVVDIGDPGAGVVAAAVVLADGENQTPTDLERDLRAALSSFKIPTRWLVVDEVPLTGTGKVDKHALRALLRDAAATDEG